MFWHDQRTEEHMFARQETLVFESVMMSVSDFLTGKPGTRVTLGGLLRLRSLCGNLGR
jgi:hypothetical protein